MSLAFSIVDYALPLPNTADATVRRKGLCTTWLESVVAAPFLKPAEAGGSTASVSVPIFLKPAKEFVLPGAHSPRVVCARV